MCRTVFAKSKRDFFLLSLQKHRPGWHSRFNELFRTSGLGCARACKTTRALVKPLCLQEETPYNPLSFFFILSLAQFKTPFKLYTPFTTLTNKILTLTFYYIPLRLDDKIGGYRYVICQIIGSLIYKTQFVTKQLNSNKLDHLKEFIINSISHFKIL